MSHTFSDLIACPTLQDRINDYFTNCPPGVVVNERTDFAEFITSRLNRANILNRQVNPGSGKTRSIQLTWTPRILETEVSDSAAQNCTSENEAGMNSETYSLDTEVGASIDEKISLSALQAICEDNESYIQSRLIAMMDAAYRKMDTDLVNQAVEFVGNFGPSESDVANDVKTVSTKYSDGKMSEDLISEVQYAAMNAGYCGNPVVFGWGELIKYGKKVNAGCCADSGLNIEEFLRQAGIVFLADRRIETVFGSNHFISMAPGALQLLYFNAFAGKNGINVVNDESYKQNILFYKGIPFDFFAKHDCGNIHMQVKLAYKLVGMPTDLFSVGDDYEGVTQVNEYVITNP